MGVREREREEESLSADGGGAAAVGVWRSRANPFKSTQLRQWGFICYLGGHIVSRRERTDRLRRASDGARVQGNPLLHPTTPLQGNDFIPPLPPTSTLLPPAASSIPRPHFRFPPFILRPPPSASSTSLPSARKADSPLHVRVEISLGLPIHIPLVPPRPSRSLSHFLSLSGNFRWKNTAFCLRFCNALASKARENGREVRDLMPGVKK